MATPPAFDLNAALRDWRAGLAASPAFKPDDLDQLEAHLRDSVATLQAPGLSANEAFAVAQLRLGTPAALVGEFAKQNSMNIWLQRLTWLVAGYVGINMLTRLISYIGLFATLAIHHFSGTHRHLATYALLVQLSVLLGSLAFFIRLRQPLFDQFAVRVHPGQRLGWILPFALITLVFVVEPLMEALTSIFLPINFYGEVWRWSAVFYAAQRVGWPLLLAWLVIRRGRTSLAR